MSDGEIYPCLYANCPNKVRGDEMYCKEHAHVLNMFGKEPGTSPIMSIPPEKRGSSYFMALTLVGMAASSAAGIGNALHRTLVVMGCALLAYFIGLRTETKKR